MPENPRAEVGGPQLDPLDLLTKTRFRPSRCAACGGRGWRLDLDERCGHCNPCCEEHFPSRAMTPEAAAEHVCPACGRQANPDWIDATTDDDEPCYPRRLGALEGDCEGAQP